MKGVNFFGYTITEDSVTIILDGEVFEIFKSDDYWDEVIKAIDSNDEEAIRNMVDKISVVKNEIDNNDWKIDGTNILYKGKSVEPVIEQKILDFIDSGTPLQHLLRFYERLEGNLSFSARANLFKFVEQTHIPITPDGMMIMYKVVRADRYDKYSETIKYEDGEVIEINRSECDDDPDSACSIGLHCGSKEYIKWYGSHGDVVIACLVDPKDVVVVPKDHSYQKIRLCKLKVLQEVKDFTKLLVVKDPEDLEDYGSEEVFWTRYLSTLSI